MKIVLKDLVKRFALAETLAVDHVSLEIEDGELAVFLGPSGCGKTTTMRMIAGLEQPDGGQIFIGERNVTNLAPKDRRVAMVFQNFTMYPSMNVYENIAFPLQALKLNKHEIDKMVREAADLVGVGKLLRRSVRQVSGGEAQRVALARAMVRRPEVFLMDEPLSSLDAKLRVQMRTEIKRLHQETRSTIIFVTHDQEEAMVLGDKIVVMEGGRVQQVGTPQDVYFRPRNTFVANFVGTPSMNLFEATICRTPTGGHCVQVLGASHPLPERYRDFTRAAEETPVTWGIRPEAWKLIEGADRPHPGDISGQVELTESLGSRILAFVRAGEQLPSVIVDALHPVRVGQPCHLRIDVNNVHLFDAKTGIALDAQG